MGFWGTLFGSTAVVEKAADTVSTAVKTGFGMLDNAFYTDQEKAADSREGMKIWLEIQKVIAGENSLRSITRRVIAWAFVAQFLLALNVCLVCVLFWSDKVDDVISVISAFQLGWIVLTIVAFYFGTYGIGQMLGGKKKGQE
jgi:hypothetical protein